MLEIESVPTVRQHGNIFEGGLHSHNHPAQVGAAIAARVTACIKTKAVQNIFKPAPAIVNEVKMICKP